MGGLAGARPHTQVATARSAVAMQAGMWLGYVSFGFSDVSVVLGEAFAFYSDLVHARPYRPIQLCGQRISA